MGDAVTPLSEAETVQFISTASTWTLAGEVASPTLGLYLQARMPCGRGLLHHMLKLMMEQRERDVYDDGFFGRQASSRWRMLKIGRLLKGPALRVDAKQIVEETVRWVIYELGPPGEEGALDDEDQRWVGRSYAHITEAIFAEGLVSPEIVFGLTRAEYLESLEPLLVGTDLESLSIRSQVYKELAFGPHYRARGA